MSSSTSAPGNGPTAGKTDLDTLKNDMKALRADLAPLLRDTRALAQDRAKASAAAPVPKDCLIRTPPRVLKFVVAAVALPAVLM